MPSSLMPAAALVGRALLAAIFLHEAVSKLTAYSAALAYMRAFGVPGELLPFAIAVELGCGVLILCGYRTRAAALLLAAFCLATAVLFHRNLGDRSSCISRRTWRSRAGSWCCSRMAPARGRSMPCGRPGPAPRRQRPKARSPGVPAPDTSAPLPAAFT
jgi:putative oxidoreductase